MTEHKEPSPDSGAGYPTSSPAQVDNRSNSSGSEGMSSSSPVLSNNLSLQVPSRSNSDSSQSSPSPRTSTSGGRGRSGSGGRGSSISSTFSTEISYRDLSDIQDEFKIVKILHDGAFSKILLAKQEQGGSSTEENNVERPIRNVSNNNKHLILKAVPSGFTDDFKRELRYNYFLSPHPNIVKSFNVSLNWASSYNVYVQEYAQLGNLAQHIPKPECQIKMVASQLASALEFMHSFKLVHQDLQPANVLVFKSNLSRVKLCDFGSTRKEGTLVTKGYIMTSSSCNSFLPPELSYLLPQERYESHRSSDAWQLGVLICLCLTGKQPWNQADFTDPVYRQYTNWLKRKSLKVPEPFRRFSPRLIRMMKRLLEPKLQLRSEVREVLKYLSDDWIKSNCTRGTSNGNANKKESSKKHECIHNANTIPTSGKNDKNKIIGLAKKIHIGSNNHNSNDKENEPMTLPKVGERERSEEVEERITKRVEHWIASATQSVEKIHANDNCENVPPID